MNERNYRERTQLGSRNKITAVLLDEFIVTFEALVEYGTECCGYIR